jgi:REP element-mobilizing transposase RayT
MAHRKTVRHDHEVGHLRELTFSCHRRMPLLTNDAWRQRLARCVEAACKEAAMELAGSVVMPEYVHHHSVSPRQQHPDVLMIRGLPENAIFREVFDTALAEPVAHKRTRLRQAPPCPQSRHFSKGLLCLSAHR